MALFFVLCANLSLTPIFLLWFRRFFFDSLKSPETCWRWVPQRVASWWIGEEETAESFRTSSFYRIGKRLTGSTAVAAVVILAITLFCGLFVYPAVTFPNYISDSFQLALPRGSAFAEAILSMQRDFGDGFLNSFRVLVIPPPGTNLVSDSKFLSALDQVREIVLMAGNISCYNIVSPFYSFCKPINPLLYQVWNLSLEGKKKWRRQRSKV